MRTKTTLVRAAVVLLIFGSTLGTRHPAAAAVVPSEQIPSDVTTPAEGIASFDVVKPELDLLVAAELARQYEERLAAWLAAEQARLAAELDALWAQWILDVDARIQARTGRYLPWPTVALVIDAAVRHGVDPVLLGRIGACESGGRADAYNASGASGFGQHLAQYWPGRAAAAGHPGASPFDLAANIDVTAWYLSAAGTSPWNPSRHCWG